MYVRGATVEGSTRDTVVIPPTDRATLFINSKMITNNFRKRLQVTDSEEITRTHLKRRTKWTDLIFDLVDWEHLELTLED